ncbi:FAD-dependent oxidoreductase [Streptomonospora litoralis]|uniref:3-hydroxybenzoate 6-hydroxylase 1 n=1 Tax=Streptomonospora litoralis TaxID=2498135 RepID=A0A4P6Q2V2_9ACTN|nr:NAD(P)/FAD-dependent oxidoreductase [Streptomonospora litoralis]QBI54895.1 3-hydroxybenzoate 6-hydroxylase 1 [Streptomonospora litoralis]
MRVLIAGAGLAGLCLHRLLRDAGHEVRSLERARSFGRLGYGIGLWSNAWQVLEQAGAADAVAQAGVPVGHWQLRDASGRLLRALSTDQPASAEETGDGARAAQRPFTVVHRADLHDALRARVPDAEIRTGIAVEDVRHSNGRTTAVLSDGTEEEADVLVGADGVHSRVRESAGGGGAADLGTAAWAFWVPEGVDVPDGFTEMWGEDGKAFLIAGVSGARMATLAMPVPADADVGDPLGYLRSRAHEWVLPEVLDHLARTGGDVFFDRNRAVAPPRFARGRVALIGDAGHALHPVIGMGATLALEDAWVLADELTGPAPAARAPQALAGFRRRRRRPVHRARREAALAQRLVLTPNPLVRRTRNALAAHTRVFDRFFTRQADELSRPLSARL